MATKKKNSEHPAKGSQNGKSSATSEKGSKAETAPQKQDKSQENITATQSDGTRSHRFSEQYLPYLWGALGLFLSVCFVLDIICKAETPDQHWMGWLGYYLCRGLFGLFGWAAILLAPVLFMLAIFWRKYCRRHLVGFQVTMSALFMLLISAFIHVCVGAAHPDIAAMTHPADLFRTGAVWESGGIIGGWLGWLMYRGLRMAGSIVLMIVTLPLLIMSMVGVTPVEVFSRLWSFIRDRHVEKKQQRRLEQEERQAREKERARLLALKQAEARARAEEEAERTKKTAVSPATETAPPPVEAEDHAPEDTSRVALVDPRTGEFLGEVPASDAVPSAPEASDDPPAGTHRRKVYHIAVGGTVPPEEPEEAEEPEAPEEADAPLTEEGSDVRDDVTPETSGRAEHMEIDPVEDTEDESSDTFTASGEDPMEALMPLTTDGRSEEVVVRVLRSDKSALTGTRDNPVDGLPEETAELPSDAIRDQTDDVSPEEDVERYHYPPIELLSRGSDQYAADEDEIAQNTRILRDTLESFKIHVKDISCSCGPTVTRYEVKPDVGIRVRSIANLVDDIALSLAKSGVRIEAPIPGKSAVGIEVPNDHPSTVYLRNLLETPEFQNHKSRIASCLGAEVSGRPVIFDINKMPHLLVSGTTGSGKSVCINCIILSILYKARPDEVKLILIDPKKVEFSVYRNIPHLYCPIVTDPKKAAGALYSAVAEMERRFELIEEVGVRNLAGYNEATAGDPEHPPMPQMVIIIDELADLMMTAPTDVEAAICRLAQKARAAGIHLILGTQRPSVDVITGLIKANIPSRIAFTVKSQVDSRTIIDVSGAEKLIGRGDMLYAPVGATKPLRIQGAFVSDSEVEEVVTYVKEHNEKPVFDEEFIRQTDAEAARCGSGKKKSEEGNMEDFDALSGDDSEDPKFWEAVEVAVDAGKVSTSLLQRRANIGYGRAAKIIDRMEEMGLVSAADGNKPRKLLITPEDFAQMKMNGFKR